MIFLVNRVCYMPHKIEQWLSKSGVSYTSAKEKEWYKQLQVMPLAQVNGSNIWVHVWDDHPFMCGRDFQIALREKRISGRNDIFIVFNDSYRLRLWKQMLDKDIAEKFGYMYTSPDGIVDHDYLNEHVFVVNSETGEHFDALVSAIRRMEVSLNYHK